MFLMQSCCWARLRGSGASALASFAQRLETLSCTANFLRNVVRDNTRVLVSGLANGSTKTGDDVKFRCVTEKPKST